MKLAADVQSFPRNGANKDAIHNLMEIVLKEGK